MSEEQTNNEKVMPKATFRVGAISVNVWGNKATSDKGTEYERITVSSPVKSYKDNEGNWKETKSLHRDEVPRAILALSKAYDFVATTKIEPENGNE